MPSQATAENLLSWLGPFDANVEMKALNETDRRHRGSDDAYLALFSNPKVAMTAKHILLYVAVHGGS